MRLWFIFCRPSKDIAISPAKAVPTWPEMLVLVELTLFRTYLKVVVFFKISIFYIQKCLK